MARLTRLALLSFAIMAALNLGPALFSPSSPAGSPYLSALSDLAATPAMAASASCGNRACDVTQFRTCFTNPGTRCRLNVRTAAGCATVAC